MGRASGANDNPRLHPVRGIGWVGFVCIAFFLTLAIGEILSPLGLRYEMLRVVAEHTPSTSSWALLLASWLALAGQNVHLYTSWGIVALLYLYPAFWLAPRDRTVLRFFVIPAWCVIESVFVYSPWSYLFADRLASAAGFPWLAATIPTLSAAIVHAALLWFATRQLSIPLTLLALIALSLTWDSVAPWGQIQLIPGVPVVFSFRDVEFRGASISAVSWSFMIIHGVMAFVIIRWALQERRRATDPLACKACGYSLEGITSNICPECGVSAPSPVSRSEMGEGRVRAT